MKSIIIVGHCLLFTMESDCDLRVAVAPSKGYLLIYIMFVAINTAMMSCCFFFLKFIQLTDHSHETHRK